MKLLICIPALNEEDSIESTIQRTLAARETIKAGSPVTEVAITVVSDGSTDQTVPRAQQYTDRITLIVFEENRGYGAAIKEAWRQSDADLLSFLDADGTCDPRFFADLCRTLDERQADVILGCRLNANSKMPLIRRVGNIIFATMLRLFSSQRVRDTASGMRVVRRSCLERLYPLPDGLHFTPAMSARALLSGDLSITEIDMPYHEREGESKLRVGKDGLRFLRVILSAAFLYRPSRPLGALGLLCVAAAVVLMIPPTLHYLQHRAVLEWMIYRFVLAHLACVAALLLFSAAYVTHRIVRITLERGRLGATGRELPRHLFTHFLHSPALYLTAGALMATGASLVLPSLFELVRTGATYEHWSRFVVMSGLFTVAVAMLVLRAVDAILDLLAERLTYLEESLPRLQSRRVVVHR